MTATPYLLKTRKRFFLLRTALLLTAMMIASGSATAQGLVEQSYRNRIQGDGRDSQQSGLDRSQHTAPGDANCASNKRSPPVGDGWRLHGGGFRTAQRPKEPQGLATRIRHELRNQVNSGLVTIILGGLESGDLSDATELVSILKGADLKLLPVAGEGAAKDVTNLLFARGIDIAVVQMDVLALLKRQAPFPGIENYLQYISTLYDEEVHILARADVQSVADLASKPVNFGPVDSGTFLTASAIFGALGIGVEITTFSQALAIDKLRRGEIAALVYTTAKPARFFQDMKSEQGLHFLPIMAPEAVRERYGQATLSSSDYPNLIEQGKPISTLSVGTVLAVYNWPAGSERYRNVASFVNTFFGRLAELRMSRHHPKWREVDIRASLPGWTRFSAALQWIKSADRSPNQPTRFAGPAFPMEGSTTSPVRLSPGFGDVEQSTAEPVFNHSKKGLPESPLSSNTAKLGLEEGHPVAFSSGQLDAFFREFVEYVKQESQREMWTEKQALFTEFQAYVKHGLQPNLQHTGAKAQQAAVAEKRISSGVARH